MVDEQRNAVQPFFNGVQAIGSETVQDAGVNYLFDSVQQLRVILD
jgi:hypothetical protein